MTVMMQDYGRTADLLHNLPDLLKQERKARGLTLRQAAEQIGVGHTLLRYMEEGRGSSTYTLIKYLRWLARDDAPPA